MSSGIYDHWADDIRKIVENYQDHGDIQDAMFDLEALKVSILNQIGQNLAIISGHLHSMKNRTP